MTPQKTSAWCDVRPITVKGPFWREQDCFVDTAGAGQLDQIWEGDSLVHVLDMARSGVGAPTHALPPPPAPAGH